MCRDYLDAFEAVAVLDLTLSLFFFCLQLENSSAVAAGFRVQLASLSPCRPQSGADRVDSLLGRYTVSQVQPTVGKK